MNASDAASFLTKTNRSSGSTRLRIDSQDPRREEEVVTAYIRGGSWRLVPCSTYKEAHDFQWFLIDLLKPLCNATRKDWNRANTARYQQLLKLYASGRAMTFAEVRDSGLNTPGVYVLEHRTRPDA